MADDKLNLTESFKEITVTRNGINETIKIPMIGQGTWMLDDTNTEKAVSDALDAGYVAIDTAQGYGNEEFVGKAIQHALAEGLSRDKLFISSKLDPDTAKSDDELGSMTEADAEREKSRIRTEIEKSFTALGLTGEHDYIDCYYIHSPAPWEKMEIGHESEYMNSVLLQWQVLNEYYQAGKIKTIGVSNFSIQSLNKLKEICEIEHLQMPQVMQMPLLIGHNEEERMRFCTENNIQPVAYSILGSKHLLDHELVKAMASKYGMTPAELCTYYTTQVLKVPSLTRSTDPERIKANSQVPNVTLSELDTKVLMACNDDCREWDVKKGWNKDSEWRFLEAPFDQDKIEATKDGVGGLNVLDLLPFADLDYDTLKTSNPEVYARYNETAQRFAETFGTLDLSTLNEVITHLTPSKALLLDNCRHDFGDEKTNLTGWLQSALITKLVNENTPIKQETVRKIYELGWQDSFSHDLELWRADERFANNLVISSLMATFERNTSPTFETPSPLHERERTVNPRPVERRVPDRDLQTVPFVVDNETRDFHFYVPYTKNNGSKIDYLEVILDNEGIYVNVAGLKENTEETTRCRILSQGVRNVGDQQYYAVGIEQNDTNDVVILPITVENNEIFFNNFMEISNGTIEDIAEIKADKIPKFTTITKDFSSELVNNSTGGSGETVGNGSGENGNQRRRTRTTTRTETTGPRRIAGNLIYKSGDISYIFLPYKTTDNRDSHLVLIQQGENLYLNIKGVDESDRAKNTTCQIFSASFANVGTGEILSLELEVNGSRRAVNFPIPKNRNEQLLSDINSLLAHNNIRNTEIEVYDCPRVSNPAFNSGINAEVPIANETIKQDKLVRTKKTGQTLESQTLSVGGESISGLSQEIDSEKLGLTTPQKITLFDSSSYTSSGASILKDALLIVTSENKETPIAVFAKGTKTEDGTSVSTVQFKVSKEFLDDFRTKNPSVEIPDGTINGDFVVYDVEKLKLSQDLNINDVQIRGASSDFAVLFSALGCQIVDKNNHYGIVSNETKPFNIGVSTDFLSTVLKQESEKSDVEKKYSFDRKGASYDALLIARIQLEREKTTQPDKIVSVTLPEGSATPEERLYSVPVTVKNDDGSNVEQYLNIRIDREGKSYAYLHITGESVKSAKIPKFYEIDIAHLEESTTSSLDSVKNPSLYLGLKDGKNVIRVNIDLDYEQNVKSLKSLKNDILNKEFNAKIEDEHKLTPLFEGSQRKIGDEDYEIYPRPKENSSNILSFDNTAILSRHPTEENSGSDPPSARSPSLPDPPIVNRQRIIQREESPVPPSQPPQPPQPQPPRRQELAPEKEEPIKPIDWKEPLVKDKPPKNLGPRNMFIILFAMCTLFSMLVPWLAIGAYIFAGIGILNEVRPWIVNIVKEKKQKEKQKERTYKPGKEKSKELQKTRKKTRSKLSKQRNHLNDLERKRQAIINDQTLSAAKKQKRLKKINKEIREARRNVEQHQLSVSNVELKLQNLQLDKNLDNAKKTLKNKRKNDKKIRKAEDADLANLQKIVTEREKRFNKVQTQHAELNELNELEYLERNNRSALTLSQIERLKKLRKKFGKNRSKRSSIERRNDERVNYLYTQYTTAQNNLSQRQQAVANNRQARQEEISQLENEISGARNDQRSTRRRIRETRTMRRRVDGEGAIMQDYTLGDLPPETDNGRRVQTSRTERLNERNRNNRNRSRGL